MKRYIALLLVLAVCTFLSACSGADTAGDETTTITGMVVNIDGSTISIIEMDSADADSGFGFGNRPSMPSDSDFREQFGDFDPENFDGTLPDGTTPPQWNDGERPEMPDGERPEMPDGERPELPDGEKPDFDGMKLVSGSDRPGFGGNRPEFGGERPVSGGDMPGFDGKTTDIDISSAHISVETEDGIREAGSLDSIKRGSFVTVTMNAKGEVTNVLVTSRGGRTPKE